MLLEERSTQTTTSTKPNHKIQLRNYERNKPTLELVQETNSLLIHQIGVEAIINQARKIITMGRPEGLANKLKMITDRKGNKKVEEKRSKLNIHDEIFIKKVTRLINKLPPELLAKESNRRFKDQAKEWVKTNINPIP